MKLAIPDLISNSYFPAVAAEDLGFFRREGLDITVELMVPVDVAFDGMREGSVQFLGGSAHTLLGGFPGFAGVKVLGALAQGTYWFLVMHRDTGAASGEIACVKGRRIGAAPWVAMGLRRVLAAYGLDPERDGIEIMPVKGSQQAGMNFGKMAAMALEAREVDGFWANGMGAEIAVRRGIGTVVLDIRRGVGPAGSFDYTFPSIACTAAFADAHPDVGRAVLRALDATHAALKAEPGLAREVALRRFPDEADLITDLIRRDAPYYEARISRHSFDAMCTFAREIGLLKSKADFEQVVAAQAMMGA